MKIGILGTRGIPNHYGGFEQFVEFVAPALVQKGHEVCVYCSSLHPYQEKEWMGVHLIHCKDPENKIGTAGQFIYDLNCILDARKRDFDVLVQLGYTSSSVFTFLMPSKPVLVTNMDGLEWKRTKYSAAVKLFLKQAERWAAKYSDVLIADSQAIQSYLTEKYNLPSHFLAYGATVFESPNPSYLHSWQVMPYQYNMLIARMEPENNIETILKGYIASDNTEPLLVVGNTGNKFGTYLRSTYTDARVHYIGAIYNLEILNNLRYFSHYYFHGHSVGGTNPSLLEAMASSCMIIAHDNLFNRSVLDENAFYFSDEEQVVTLLNNAVNKEDFKQEIEKNILKIKGIYSWDYINSTFERILSDACYAKKWE